VFRFLLVLLALTDDASTRRSRHACSFTRLHERRTRGRATRMRIRRQESESWWLPSGVYIQQVISQHLRRHFYFRDTTANVIKPEKLELIGRKMYVRSLFFFLQKNYEMKFDYKKREISRYNTTSSSCITTFISFKSYFISFFLKSKNYFQ